MKHSAIPFLAAALVEAAAIQLNNKYGINADKTWLHNLLDQEYADSVSLGEASAWDCPFEENVAFLVDSYETMHKEEIKKESPSLEDIIDGMKVGVNIIPNIGIAVAKDEDDLAAMKQALKSFFGAAILMDRLFR